MFDWFKKKKIGRLHIIIAILAILAVIGWAVSIYLIAKPDQPQITCGERFTKLNSYATLLEDSTRLARQEKSLAELEQQVRALDSGSLLSEWQAVVLGGNREEDLNDYFDIIIDSLKFFSR
ncbi:MAG: hypothetical protein GF387_01800 [Candidatus Portnoybacteria bacterium]|nr:hypothetical protein [Candidatus Portnoybacteria bacterium]